MKFQLYSRAVLAEDLPKEGLRRGDVVTLVEHLVAANGTEGCAIEVFNALGETIAVTCVAESALEPLRANEILSVWQWAAAQHTNRFVALMSAEVV